MNERRKRWLFTAFAVVACGEPGSGGVDPHAFERPDAKANAQKLADLRRKTQAQAEARAAAEEVAVKAAVEAVTIVPPQLPTRIDRACGEVAAAMEALVVRQFADDAPGLAAWQADKPQVLADLRKQCEADGQIEVAACQAHAMRNADDRLVGNAFGLMDRCREKFGEDPSLAQRGARSRAH